MNSNNHPIRFFSFLILFLLSTLQISATSLDSSEKSTVDSNAASTTQNDSDQEYIPKLYKYGYIYEFDWLDLTTLEQHLQSLKINLSYCFKFMFEQYWNIKSKESLISNSDLSKTIKDQLFVAETCYRYIRTQVINYIETDPIPLGGAWRLGVITGFYSNYLNENLIFNQTFSKQEQLLSCLDFYKTSIWFISYSLNISTKWPDIFHYDNYSTMVSSPTFSSEIDRYFQNEFTSTSVEDWIKAAQELNPEWLDHLYNLFHCISNFILVNRESLPESSLSIAAQLTNINSRLLISTQKNANNNLDAINAFMFKIYIELKKWKAIQEQGQTITCPDLQTLLPIVQKECLKLLPQSYRLEDITEENEYEICKNVRMRNLITSGQSNGVQRNVKYNEFEHSPDYTVRFYGYIQKFLCDRFDFVNGFRATVSNYHDLKMEQIYNYRSGFVELNNLPIDESNALEYLINIKVFDLLIEAWNTKNPHDNQPEKYSAYYNFPRTTYELRKHILKLCPHLRSYEALTLSINPDKVRDEQDEATEGLWVAESEAIRQACIDELVANAKYLSDLMHQSPLQGIVVGSRGISGSGKSTFIKRNILPLLLTEDQNEPEYIELLAKGILNPDTLKATLKKLQGDTLNTQVHDEASNAFKKAFKEIAEQGSYILDKRQLTPHDIIKTLVEPAEKIGHSVWLFDFDIPLSTCMYRILARPLKGNEPCPEYEALIDGYLSLRRYRSQVIALACKVDSIVKYELFATSKQILVAHKMSEQSCPNYEGHSESLCIHNHHLLENCLKIPTYAEIEEELSLTITDASIDEAIANGDISFEQRESLDHWRGMSIKEAIQRHVQGVKGNEAESLFEPVELMPFNGEEWLSGTPHIIDFIEGEHRLHLHGVDETGRGLHWESGELKRDYSAKYYPETKITEDALAGYQMKLGYFIVPKNNLQMTVSACWPSRQLVVGNEETDWAAMRFFVHPAAYAHYAPLFAANIKFVPPSQSEFIGTPTSTYNSWIVRRIDKGDYDYLAPYQYEYLSVPELPEGSFMYTIFPSYEPFIVRMGAPNGSGDIKHLLAGEDVLKSLSLQEELDKLPDNENLTSFKETGGLILKDISHYPSGTVDSGNIITEFPKDLLFADSRYISFATAISCERIRTENIGLATLDANLSELHSFPIIYEIIQKSLQLGVVETPQEFVQKYLIDGFISAFESMNLKANCKFTPENLYLVLNMDNTFKGFAFRDLQGMSLKKKPAESFSCPSYQLILKKLLSVLTRSDSDELSYPDGTTERSIYYYLNQKLNDVADYQALDSLYRLSISQDEALQLLNSQELTIPKP